MPLTGVWYAEISWWHFSWHKVCALLSVPLTATIWILVQKLATLSSFQHWTLGHWCDCALLLFLAFSVVNHLGYILQKGGLNLLTKINKVSRIDSGQKLTRVQETFPNVLWRSYVKTSDIMRATVISGAPQLTMRFPRKHNKHGHYKKEEKNY